MNLNLTLLLLLMHFALFSQNFVFEKLLEVKTEFFTTDNLGNIYLVKNNQIIKLDENGNLIKTFSDNSSGSIHSIDASNPLKILVFYKDFAIVNILDNTLSMKGDRIYLEKLGYSQTSKICSSYENGMWVFDPLTNQLIRFDQNLLIKSKSGNLFHITGSQVSPVYIKEQQEKLYVYDNANGLLVFDIFGNYLKTITITGLSKLQILSDVLIFWRNNSLIFFHLKTLVEKEFKFTENFAEPDFCLSNEKLLILNNPKLKVYKIINE